MLKEIKIYNRFNMDNFAMTGGLNFPYVDKPWNVISIYGDGDGPLLTTHNKKVFRQMGCKYFLSLQFWDITNRANCPNGILFRKTQAKQIIAMLDDIQSEDEDSVLVAHCSAGISRSGAVGTFACDYCELDYNKFMKDNPYIMSNPHVLRLLRECAGMQPSFGIHDGIDKTEHEQGAILIPPGAQVKEKKGDSEDDG